MLLRCHVTVGVIRERENSRDDCREASGRHKTQKYVLIRTFHLVRLDFIVCAVSVNVLVMGVQLLYHERLNTLSVGSNIDFTYQQKPIGAFWIISTVREGNKSKGRKKMRVCVGDVLQTLFLQSLLCCCAASVISRGKSQLFLQVLLRSAVNVSCVLSSLTGALFPTQRKTPPHFPGSRNSMSRVATISPVSGQRPHLCIGPSQAPVFILACVGASVSAFAHK